MSYKKRNRNNNQFKVNYAFPGICSLCFDEVAEFNGSNPESGKPIITRVKPNYRELRVLLNDSSQMMITLCSDCYIHLKPKDIRELSENEINGWQSELDLSIRDKWSEAKKKKYMKVYSKKYIINKVHKPYGLKDQLQVAVPRTEKLNIKVTDDKEITDGISDKTKHI